MYGPILTPQEYDNLLTDVERAQLAQITRQPYFDKHPASYRHRFGAYRAGTIQGDPVVSQVVGYGQFPPPVLPSVVPVTPVYGNGPGTHP
jgi:hypothetical protein